MQLRTNFASSYGWALLIASIFSLVPNDTRAGVTINARTVSLADVSAAVALASEGDTVVVPAGTARWALPLNITKGITLQGATTVDTSSALGTANDRTIILDDGVAPNQIITVTLSPNQVFRMTGLTLAAGTSTAVNGQGVNVSGICPGASGTGSFRVDHCHFSNLNRNVDLQLGGWLYGVIDHCLFYGGGMAINIHHDRWGNTPQAYGDGSWAEPPYFGSNKFVFIEDNCIDNSTNNGSTAGIDAKHGARFVVRYNHMNSGITGPHGTEGQRSRGARVMEFYNNIVSYSFDFPSGTNFRSGTGVVHDNQYINKCHGIGNIQAYRTFHDFGPPFGQANGTNKWDQNDGSGHLQVAIDQPGRGKSDLVTGDNPTPAFPHNALEPIYVWGNSVQNPNYSGMDTMAPMVEGRDIHNNTPMPGYTPYTYPHPLVTGAPAPLAPPTNLRVTPGQ